MESRAGLAVFLSFSVVVACVTGAAACSSDKTPSTPATEAGVTPGTGAEGGAPPATPAQCAMEKSFLECRLCCGLGEKDFKAQQAFVNCLCDGPCKTQCAKTGCDPDVESDAGADAGTACEACLDSEANGMACAPKAQEACAADPACKAYQDCNTQAKCSDKPDN